MCVFCNIVNAEAGARTVEYSHMMMRIPTLFCLFGAIFRNMPFTGETFYSLDYSVRRSKNDIKKCFCLMPLK